MVRGAVTRSWLRIHARDTTQVQRGGGGGGGCWATPCGSHGSDSHHGCWGSEISSVLIGLRRRAAVCESELQPGHFKSSWDCNTRVVPTWPLELAHTGRHMSHTHTQTHTESIDAASQPGQSSIQPANQPLLPHPYITTQPQPPQPTTNASLQSTTPTNNNHTAPIHQPSVLIPRLVSCSTNTAAASLLLVSPLQKTPALLSVTLLYFTLIFHPGFFTRYASRSDCFLCWPARVFPCCVAGCPCGGGVDGNPATRWALVMLLRRRHTAL